LHASANAVGRRARIADFALFSRVFDPITTGPEKIPWTGSNCQIWEKTTVDGESWFAVYGCQIWVKITTDGKKISTVRGCQIGKNESRATVRGSFGTI
jgi:hypothetical protein